MDFYTFEQGRDGGNTQIDHRPRNGQNQFLRITIALAKRLQKERSAHEDRNNIVYFTGDPHR